MHAEHAQYKDMFSTFIQMTEKIVEYSLINFGFKPNNVF